MFIYIICPVKYITEQQKQEIKEYVLKCENEGHKVHNPLRDTEQLDCSGGYRICRCHKHAIRACDQVHIFYSEKSEGTKFDLGIVFAYSKIIKLISILDENTSEKNFLKVLKEYIKDHRY